MSEETVPIAVLRFSPAQTGAHTLELFQQDERPDWLEKAVATAELPADFGVPDAAGTVRNARWAREELASAAANAQSLQRVGAYLFTLLSSGAVGPPLKNLLAIDPLLPSQKKWLIVIDTPAPQDGASLDHRPDALPWELLFWEQRWLFKDPVRAWVRGRIRFDLPPEEPRRWPLKALVVVGTRPKGQEFVDIRAEEEVDSVVAAFRDLGYRGDVEVLLRPSQKKLMQWYDDIRPDILHFIGHGDGGLLVTDDETGNRWRWDAVSIRNDLQGKAPRVAFLNACRSSNNATSPNDLLATNWSVTSALLAAGTRAVIGMQGDIPGMAAEAFSKSFYDSLSKLLPIHDAIATARTAASATATRGEWAWALPTISLQVRPERVLKVSFDLPPTFDAYQSHSPELQELQTFVGRRHERRNMRLCMDGERHVPSNLFGLSNPDQEHARVVVIRGVPRVGKTALVLCCLDHCARRGYRSTYLDLSKATDFLGVLRLIRDGNGQSPLQAGFRAQPERFRSFNRDLNWILDGRTPPGMNDGDEDDAGAAYDERKIVVSNPIERILSSFRAALVAVTADQRVVLALDGLGFVARDGNSRLLRSELFDPIARGEIANLRLILTVQHEQHKLLDLEAIKPIPEQADVPSFESSVFWKLLREYARFPADSPQTQVLDLLEQGQVQHPPYGAEEFKIKKAAILMLAGVPQ